MNYSEIPAGYEYLHLPDQKAASPGRRETSGAGNRLALVGFLAPLEILAFTDADAVVYGRIRAALEKSSLPIGAYDLLIGSQALAEGLTLVTNNEREFRRIHGLSMENWA